MASLTDELDPQERLKYKKKAYDAFTNMPIAQEKQAAAQSTQIGMGGLRDIYKGIQTGGFEGRQQASTAQDATQLALAKAAGQQAQARDALNVQGAGMKEDIIGARQANALGAFNRQTRDMTDAMDKAVAERAFDLGMSSKELAFHTNSAVADIGLANLKADYDTSNVSRTELLKVASNLEMAAEKSKEEAANMLAQLRREGTQAASAQERKRAFELNLALLEKQKDAMKKQAKAANIAAVLKGGAIVAGAVVGGPVGAAAGGALGELGSSLYNQ